ncbi:MAG TPA: carboxypeptidase-like regulatory domain-containing protein, partial [Membranihabitans sp.]|nr:carboxypeptidase-like regulatory domain-containing protein [Membranihabitans sp.]
MYAIPHNTRISETTMLSPVVDVTGQVTDQQGEPLIGVNVLIKGSNQGTSTDVEGNFSINNVEETAVLVFSYIGYQTLEVNLDGRSSIVVKMASDAQLLDE